MSADGLQQQQVLHLVQPGEEGLRLDQCLARAVDVLSRRKARAAIAAGSVWLNGHATRVMSRRVRAGDRITWFPPDNVASDEVPSGQVDWSRMGGRPAVVFRDAHLAVVSKPSGIATEPTRGEDLRTSLRRMEALLREEGTHPSKVYVTAVHRLDTQASGLVVLALTRQAAAHLSAQFAERTASRTYQALVVGHTPTELTRLEHWIAKVGPRNRRGVVAEGEGKRAVAHLSWCAHLTDASWVELRLETGRTHQIRVQMAAIGHSLLGDRLYGTRPAQAERLMLHARTLTLMHPTEGRALSFEAPLPDDFEALLTSLRS
ncbi:MAG: RluA family pseudouridine synthase [Myxococcota bacterium]